MNASLTFLRGDAFQGGNTLRWFPPWGPPFPWLGTCGASKDLLGGISHPPPHPPLPKEGLL